MTPEAVTLVLFPTKARSRSSPRRLRVGKGGRALREGQKGEKWKRASRATRKTALAPALVEGKDGKLTLHVGQHDYPLP